ncbi:MAG: putative baseplate assembly protein [Allosphingosinicella sp.]
MAGDPRLCCDSDGRRRGDVRGSRFNGIDYVEVDCSQTTLIVYFLGRAPDWIESPNVRIEGGIRERDIRILAVRIEPAEDEGLDDRLIVTVDRPGDFSTYRLCIVALDGAGRPLPRPPADFDPRYAGADFSFKASCPSDLDCAAAADCPAPVLAEPAINYLAKDYGSFRQLILDRLALTLPEWRERRAPDLMVALVELLAYAGDHLSYQQDAVAAEAYLGTARLRISVRRHARLVDYHLHEGCNARCWLAFETSEDKIEIAAADVYFLTPAAGRDDKMLREEDLEPAPEGRVAFEPLLADGAQSFTLRKARNRISFYDWGQDDCCLAAGATGGTLVDPGELPKPLAGKRAKRTYAPSLSAAEIEAGLAEGRWHLLGLEAGQVLVFEERIGPRTGNAADADPHHRHAVRLTRAAPAFDPLARRLVWEVEWCVEDALPFPLCLSSRADPPGCEALRDVSVALGNVILADEGQRTAEDLPPVQSCLTLRRCADDCAGAEQSEVPERYRPRLRRPEPTFASPHRVAIPSAGGCGGAAAAAALAQDVTACTAAIELRGRDGRAWRAQGDLLASGPDDRAFVVEVDDRRIANLRFGDGVCGRMPEAGELFRASYRVGSGPAGNVGADSLTRIVFRNAFPDGASLAVRNPLRARGGSAPEPVARARLRAPRQFHSRLERAVIPADYAAIAMRDFPGQVQRAGAMLRSSGAAIEIQVAIDSLGSADPDRQLLALIETHLQRYRRIGHDVRVIPARVVPLELEMTVCVHPAFVRGHVRAALERALGTRAWAGGRGFFHPDSLSLGDPVRISRIEAAAHQIEGVASVIVTRLERRGEGPNGEVAAGVLNLRPLEVARLDNDPSLPENGTLTLIMRDGR